MFSALYLNITFIELWGGGGGDRGGGNYYSNLSAMSCIPIGIKKNFFY